MSLRPLAPEAVAEGWPEALPHPRPFCAELVVAPEHLSRGIPHANNAEYVRWIDRVAELHCDSLGFERARLLDQQRAWFVARHEIDYRGEAWLGETLLLATWVRSLGRTSSWRETRIVRPRDGRLIASAATRWAFVDLTSRRATRVPDEMRTMFDPLERTALDPVPDRMNDLS